MAALFAAAYGNLDWQAITTSTRARAIEYGGAPGGHDGLDACADERLDEMHYGNWQGLSKDEAAARDWEYFARWQRDPSIGPPLGESPKQVAARAAAAVLQLRDRHAEGNLLIVVAQGAAPDPPLRPVRHRASPLPLWSELAGRRGDADRSRRRPPVAAAVRRRRAPRGARPAADAPPAGGVRLRVSAPGWPQPVRSPRRASAGPACGRPATGRGPWARDVTEVDEGAVVHHDERGARRSAGRPCRRAR